MVAPGWGTDVSFTNFGTLDKDLTALSPGFPTGVTDTCLPGSEKQSCQERLRGTHPRAGPGQLPMTVPSPFLLA